MTAREHARVGVIGVGNMGSALVHGWLRAARAGAGPEMPILVFDADGRRMAALAAGASGDVVEAESAGAVAAEADTLVLSVKPQILASVITDIAGSIDDDTTVVSTAAGVGLATVREWLGPGPALLRIMPNLAVARGSGVVALAPEDGTPGEVVAGVSRLLEPFGLVELLPEGYFDAVTAVTASGPGFVALLVEGLEDGAVQAGLPRSVARRFVRQMLAGTAALLGDGDASAADLKDAVASPGGTTIAGLAVLEDRGVRGALMRAVEAATRRGAELSGRRA